MNGPILLLLLSVVVLFAAPLFAWALLKRPALASLLDGFVVVSVAGVVAVHVLPESALRAGSRALLAFFVGLVLPVLLHRLERTTLRRALDGGALVVLGLGILAHAILDGEALRQQDAVSVGVLLHRLPAGLAFWLVLKPRVGRARTLGVMAIYALGTAVGTLSHPLRFLLVDNAGGAGLALFQAFVAGSILHVVVEAPAHGDSSRVSRALGVVGAALGCAVIWLLSLEHGNAPAAGHSSAWFTARALAGAIAPAYLLSLLAVGLLSAFFTRKHARILGAPAHVVPALFLTLACFGPWLLLLRLCGMASIALTGRAVVGPLLVDDDDRRSRALRLWSAARGALDHTAPWLLVGITAAALVEPALSQDALALPVGIAIALCALAALPLYLCAAGLTPLAAMVVHKGLPLSAALVLLLLGPSLSLSALAHVRRAHGLRAALRFFCVTLVVALAAGALPWALGWHGDIALHDRWLRPVLDDVGLLLLLPLVVGSLYRQGVRPFIEQMLTSSHALEDAHVHGPGCAHEHGTPLAPVAPRPRAALPRVALPFDPREPS